MMKRKKSNDDEERNSCIENTKYIGGIATKRLI